MMGRILRRIFKTPVRESKESFYKKQGNLIAGKNCQIDNLNVTIFGASPGILNVEIGDDCMLEGNLYLYSSASKIKIGDRVFFAGGSSIYCYDEVEVGSDVMISWGCTVIDTNAHSLNSKDRMNDVVDWKKGWEYKNWSVVESKKVKIGASVWIGFNSIILKGVDLGGGSIVGAGSVVSKSFEAYSVIGGNPAVFIKKAV